MQYELDGMLRKIHAQRERAQLQRLSVIRIRA
jgi:hypothetical protein